jgi:hypothetical protein
MSADTFDNLPHAAQLIALQAAVKGMEWAVEHPEEAARVGADTVASIFQAGMIAGWDANEEASKL